MDATRNLIRQALKEHRNKRLILLSESGIPLYPPQAVHHQLLSESKSRMNSCGGKVRHPTSSIPAHCDCSLDSLNLILIHTERNDLDGRAFKFPKVLALQAGRHRMTNRMGQDIVSHWRKSSQWVALLRKHALLIADDVDFDAQFRKYCVNAFDPEHNR